MPTKNATLIASHPPRRGKKYFTVDEANRALSFVARVVADVREQYRSAVKVRQRIERAESDQSIEQLRREYEQLMDQLNAYIDELALVGVELKDFERGLIDFPSIHEGREVCLCWQHGEGKIVAWHETDAGFAGRQDVACLGHHAEVAH